MMILLTILFIFIFGVCIGSFLNVCIYRLPRGESIVNLPSHCTSCGNRLRTRNLVPILSYLVQKGRCSNCGERISPRYMFVELITATVYLTLFYKYGLNIEFFAMAVLSSILIVMFFVDLEFSIIPDSLVLFGTAGGLILYAASFIFPVNIYGDRTWWNPILGSAMGSIFFILIAILGSIIYKTDGTIGGGDIKILFPIGLFLGWKLMTLALFISIVVAGVMCTLLLISKKITRKGTVPFGPFISVGTYITILFGWQLMDLYFH